MLLSSRELNLNLTLGLNVTQVQHWSWFDGWMMLQRYHTVHSFPLWGRRSQQPGVVVVSEGAIPFNKLKM